MVIVKIMGGLGNQLFQYAFGKYLEIHTQDQVKYDVNVHIKNKNFTQRDLDIDYFKVQLPFCATSEKKTYVFFKNEGFFRRIERKLAQKFPYLHRHYKVQKNAHSNEFMLESDSYYEGYWQYSEYLDEVREGILQEIKPNALFYEKHASVLRKMQESNSVAIHIRRGDYISIKVNADLFEVCDMEYYAAAMQLIESRISNPRYFVFTQDTEWAQENFKGNDYEFIQGNSAIDDMLLISFCKNQIIANSTFSWWGAWLNQQENKVVVAPKKWYKGLRNKQTHALFPNTWIRL